VKFIGQGVGFWVLSIKQGPNHTKFYPRLLNNLKIIKLFLLNTMENKKPRKIGLTFLPFLYIFLQISLVL
jgi:hypothetical protein